MDITSVKMCAYASLRVNLSDNNVMYVYESVDVCFTEYAFMEKVNGFAHNERIIPILKYVY